ncbi:hypothetical protein ACJIZ3_016416 [Penstemon smallii]|uniref:LRAT domain-containing protein n=1 Tax=Penstemon smallii TaxID=265156 RepID=A0ABD3RQJ7_9LAMI
MGLLTNRVERSEIKAGDHIYTYRAVFAYSHHGIFVGGSKVVHFTRVGRTEECPTFPDCGFRRANSGVLLSCLNCFLKSGSLYSFEYEVSPSLFLAKLRGGTCTIAASDPTETVIHRAIYLLQNGFGNYHVFQNNCEDFALYCKTGLLTVDRLGVGSSGQASTVLGAPLAALLSSPLKLLLPSPVGVATVTAGMYCMSRYVTDIGVRTDVVKVPVEDLSLNLNLGSRNEQQVVAVVQEETTTNVGSKRQRVRHRSGLVIIVFLSPSCSSVITFWFWLSFVFVSLSTLNSAFSASPFTAFAMFSVLATISINNDDAVTNGTISTIVAIPYSFSVTVDAIEFAEMILEEIRSLRNLQNVSTLGQKSMLVRMQIEAPIAIVDSL